VIPGSVVLALALAAPAWIDVPFTRQEKNGCGSASVWMILQYWGVPSDSPEDIHRILFSNEAGGVFASDIETFLDRQGFTTLAFKGEWNDLVENIGKGRPLLVAIEANSRGTPLHYVLITGIDEAQQLVFLNDPARRKLLPVARSDFEKLWDSMDRWTLLALPREGAVPNPPPPGRPPAPPPTVPDPIFEAASVAFRAGEYTKAKQLAARSADSSIRNELLATVFFLEENLEAALKYWNRNETPYLREVRLDYRSRWNPVLLDHMMGIARGTVLNTSDFRFAQRQLHASGAFSSYRFDLNPAGDDFDFNMRASEKPLWSPLGSLRGLPFETLSPSLTNVSGKGIHIAGLWRWDKHKRRVQAGLSAPLSPTTRYSVSLDARRETWNVDGVTIPVSRDQLDAGIYKVANDRWSWASGAILLRRPSGYTLKYSGQLEHDLLRIPERKISVDTGLRFEAGRTFSAQARLARIEGESRFSWFPQAAGDDYGVSIRASSGRVWGDATIDELFSAGVDRDKTLQLRGHRATRDGRKGAGPTGRRYVLLNSEFAKDVLSSSFVQVRLVPFLDLARIGTTYMDAGAELRVSIASMVTVSVSLGRDLKHGRNVIFVNTSE
jgi:hypothetical protein